MNSKGYTNVSRWGGGKVYHGKSEKGELKVMKFEELKCVQTLTGN